MLSLTLTILHAQRVRPVAPDGSPRITRLDDATRGLLRGRMCYLRRVRGHRLGNNDVRLRSERIAAVVGCRLYRD